MEDYIINFADQDQVQRAPSAQPGYIRVSTRDLQPPVRLVPLFLRSPLIEHVNRHAPRIPRYSRRSFRLEAT